tara:strand:- start:11 stop:199 length:189 start_codon:yes stop_codon:yes gene_type:complete
VNIDDWNDLGFNPTEDGYFASAAEIKQRMIQREKDLRKAKLMFLGLSFLTVAVLSTVIYLLV